MAFKKEFLEKVNRLYPDSASLHEAIANNDIREIYDLLHFHASFYPDIDYQTFMEIETLEELHSFQEKVQKEWEYDCEREKLWEWYISGHAFADKETIYKYYVCPYRYSLMSENQSILNYFNNCGTFRCSDKKITECWKRFEKLGLDKVFELEDK